MPLASSPRPQGAKEGEVHQNAGRQRHRREATPTAAEPRKEKRREVVVIAAPAGSRFVLSETVATLHNTSRVGTWLPLTGEGLSQCERF